MGKQRLILLLVCLLLFCGGLAWAFLGKLLSGPPGNQPAPARAANEDSPSAQGRTRRLPSRFPAEGPATGPVADTGSTTGAPVDQPPTDTNGETQDWVLKGRLGAVVINGHDILGMVPAGEIPWSLTFFDFDNKEATDASVAHPDLDQNLELQGIVSRTELSPESAARAWWSAAMDMDQDNPLQAAVDADPRPDPATVKGLFKPVIRGNVIDFGTIRLVADEPGTHSFVLVGRVLGPGDVPLCSFADYVLQCGKPASPSTDTYFRANGQGRFATFLWLEREDGDVSDAHPEDLDWQIKYGDEAVQFEFERSRSSGHPTSLGPKVLAQPRRTGNVLDFGDIRLDGALLEITCEISGVVASPPPTDLFLDEGDGNSTPVHVELTCGDLDFSTSIAPAMVIRMVVPEGRYLWSAILNHPEVCCAPPSGNIAARTGQRTALKVVFTPLPLIPVKVLDPQGNPLSDATINWSIEVNDDDWIEAAAVKGNLVPVLAGKATNVSGLHARYEQAEATAEPGAKEVTLQFTTGVGGTGSLTLILPKLPAQMALPQMVVQMTLESDRQRSYLSERLYAEKQDKHSFTGLAPSTCTATLKMGGSFGYPGGVLSVLENIVVTAGATLELEFPAIAPPPWLVPVGKCTAKVSVGTDAATLRGTWEFETRKTNLEIEDGDVILRARGVKDALNGGNGFVPSAFAPGEQRFATTVIPPPAAWGDAIMQLDLPSRLHVRVLRRGQPVEAFSSRLEDAVTSTSCCVQATQGSAHLWAPGNKARLVVQFDNNAMVMADVELGPAEVEHVVELDWVKVIFRQQGENQALWGLAPSNNPDDVNAIAVNQELMLAPARFRVRPQRDVDQSAAFDLDLTDGKDREIDLPAVFAAESADVLLHMSESDWEGYRYGEFRFWAPSEGIDHPQTAEFTEALREIEARELPDAILLRSVPFNRQILLQGTIYRRDAQGRNRPWYLKPIAFKAGKENKFRPQWVKCAELHEEWNDVYCRCVSDFAGYWTGFQQDEYAASGRHELVFLDGEGVELFRAVIEIPASASQFRIPADIRARLEQANLLAPEEPPEPDDS